MTRRADKSSIALEQYVVTASQSTLVGSTFHRGSREDGTECGQTAPSGWAQFEAPNPMMAVVDYAHAPCTKCFNGARTRALEQLHLALHSPTITSRSVPGIIESLPWDTDVSEVLD